MKRIIHIVFFIVLSNHFCSANKTIIYTEVQLQSELQTAKPGDTLQLLPRKYTGNYKIPATVNGLSNKPIVLNGTEETILDGGTISTGYVLHVNASYWIISNITITNGLKGLMCDGGKHNVFDHLQVHQIGEEAIHLRKFSSFNIIQNCNIHHTGLKTPDYGEGIYIGTAVSNWNKYTDGNPDESDSNVVRRNHIGPYISAECIDIKEGTTGGIIELNYFDATGITGANSADSWIDVKGNGYLITKNKGFNPRNSILKDGFQVHCAVMGYGNDNVFSENDMELNCDGLGIQVVLNSSKGSLTGNKVFKNNTIKNGKALTNIQVD